MFQTALCILSSFFYGYLAAFGQPYYKSFDDYADQFFIYTFSIDAFVTFFVCVTDADGKEIKVFTEIATHYFFNGLIFNLVTIIPFLRMISPNLVEHEDAHRRLLSGTASMASSVSAATAKVAT